MAACASCGRDNPNGFSYCGGCGAALRAAPPCARCGFVNPAGQRYCGECGAALEDAPASPRPAAAEERKLATVLFADVVGFTALAETSDPESLARTVDSALRAMADVVVEHGGTIDKYLGDALMAVFGVPAAHEDDAARAVAAALRMRDTGGELRFSIGINTGEVMVTPVGDGAAPTVIGDTVNVAARLESAAGAGEILVGPLTAELVRDRFSLREREPTVLKGRTQPVAVHEVTGERVPDATVVDAPALVGRDGELAFLMSRWHGVTAGSRPEVVVLTGNAGAGKSRLIDELAAGLGGSAAVVRAACPGYGALVASRLSVELARQLGLDCDDVGGAGAFDQGGFWRLRRRIAELTTERALLVVIDDAHNASASDLDPLLQLVSRLGELPVLLVLAGRLQPGDWLTRIAGATTLRLEPLRADDAVRLAALLGGDLSLPAEALGALAAQAGGNPLHLRELIRLLRAGGGEGQADGDRLPATLQAVLAARVDALPAADKTVLQDVAVFSDGATAAEIGALNGTRAEPGLDRLLAAGLLREREQRYQVADPLLREVAYEQLPHAARAERHRRAATVASTAAGRARHLGLAARYLPGDAGLRAEAAAELARAGITQLDAGRFGDGSQLVQRALDLGHADPRTLLRLAQAFNDAGPGGNRALELLDSIDAAGDPVLGAEVVHARGNAMRAVDLEASATLLGQAADAWAALGIEEKRAWAVSNRGHTYFDMGRLDEAARDHEAALAAFTRLGDRSGAAGAAQALALERPDDPRVPEWLAEGLRLAEATGDLAVERNVLITLVWFQFLRSHLGGERFTRETRAGAERLLRVCAEMGDLTFQIQAHCVLAILDRLDGRLDAAAAHLARAAGLLRGLDPGAASAYSAGLLDAAEYMVRIAADPAIDAPAAHADTTSPIAIVADVVVIEALLMAGRFEAAASHLAGSALEGLALAAPFFARMLGVLRAAVMLRSGRVEDLEPGLVAARDAARRLGAYPNVVAASALLAEMMFTRGDDAGARAELAGVPDDPEGFAGLLLQRARCLAGDTGACAALAQRCAELSTPGVLASMPTRR